MSVAALLQAKHLVGYDSKVLDNLFFMSEQLLVYVSGAVIVVYHTDQHTQRFISGAAHNKQIHVLQISPNHQYLAVAERGTIGTSNAAHIGIGIYDLITLKKCKTLVSGKIQQQLLQEQQQNAISGDRRESLRFTSIAFSRDNRFLIGQATGPQWSLVYWEWESNKVVATTSVTALQLKEGTPVRQVAFHLHDNAQVYILGSRGCFILRMDEANIFKVVACRLPVDAAVSTWCLSLVSDSRMLLGSDNGQIFLFEGNSESQKQQFNLVKMTSENASQPRFDIVLEDELVEEHSVEENPVTHLITFSKGFACCCNSNTVYIFERYAGGSVYRQAAAIKTPTDEMATEVKDTTFSESEQSSSQHRIIALTISPSEDVLAIATDNRRIYTFMLTSLDINKNASLLFEPLTPNFHCGGLCDISVCLRKPIAVTCALDQTVAVWNYHSNQLQLFRRLSEDVFSVALHPTGVYLLMGCSSKLFLMGLMIDDIRVVHEFPIKNCNRCSFSHGGHYIAAVQENNIVVYSAITFDRVSVCKGHVGKITGLSWSMDDLKLISCGSDGAVIEWDVHSTKRINEVKIKGSCNHVTVSRDNYTSFVVSSASTVCEVAESQILGELAIPTSSQLSSVVALHNGRAVFVSSEQGTVWSVSVPLTSQEDWQEFQPISGNIVNMKLTHDDKWLLSVSDDGTLGVWKITDKDGRQFQEDEEQTFSEEILITRADLEEKNLVICELGQQVRDLQSQMELESLVKEQEYTEKSRRMIERFQNKIATAERSLQELQSTNEELVKSHKDTLNAIEERNRRTKERMVAETHQKLVLEYHKYSELQTFGERQHREQKCQLDRAFADKELSLERMSAQNEANIQRMSVEIQKYERMVVEANENAQRMVRLVEEDADLEIQALKASHSEQLANDREATTNIKAEIGILKQKIISLQKEVDRQQKDLEARTIERQHLENQISALQVDIVRLKREVQNRDGLLQAKENLASDLRQKNWELDKLRSLHEFRIEQLKEQLDPAVKRMKTAEEQLLKTNNELQCLKIKMKESEFANRNLKERLDITNVRLKNESQKAIDARTTITHLRGEMSDLVSCRSRTPSTRLAPSGVVSPPADMTDEVVGGGSGDVNGDQITPEVAGKERLNLTATERKIPPQNIVLRLIRRETHVCRPSSQAHVVRSFHQNVFPNFTVVNVEKPPCFLRKFSPEGRHFVAFSSDQTSIEIYEYLGPAGAEDLLSDVAAGAEYTSATSTGATSSDYHHHYHGHLHGSGMSRAITSTDIRGGIFKRFFRLRHVVSVASNGEQLNRECSLFTDDGRYVIVGSAATIDDSHHPHFFERYRNNESVSPNQRLEDFSLHIVDLYSGALCDTRAFKVDKIFLSHNQGLYLYRNTLAVLSVQHQTIHVFRVTGDGSFVEVRAIGRLCYDDDEFFMSTLDSGGGGTSTAMRHYPQPTLSRPFREKTINCLKHRLLAFLYRHAASQGAVEGDPPTHLRTFYKHFDQFLQLRMWKMQLLDEDHLLIKYASEEVVTLTADPSSQPAFFVVYNMVTTHVLAVFENTSEKLLKLFENFCDLFRNATLHLDTQFPCSPSSNIHARLIQQRFKQTIINAKFGGHTEAVKRLLTQLPISSQSYSSSPYLDLSLFSYDDKWVSLMERPKTCGDHPIRFYSRDSGLLKFKIHAGVLGRNPPPTARRLVAFTFHPYDPFAISVQRTNSEYVVNFHVRHNAS